MSTEYRFYCPELQREVSTAECYDRGNSGRACYGECCEHVERAICRYAEKRLRECYGDQIRVALNETDCMLTISFHEYLTLEAYYDRLFRTVDFDAHLHTAHGHQFPAEDAEGLVRIVGMLLNGEMIFIVRGSRIFGCSLRMVEKTELQSNWRKYTRGQRTRLIDGKGRHEKEAYRQRMNPDAC